MAMADLWVCGLLAAVCAVAAFLVRMRDAIGPDEGYLWYGTLRVLEGQVPLIDFRSYEPGRYYWCAMWMLVFGRSIVALRLAVHLFFCLGLTAGLFALHLTGMGWPGTVAAAIILTVWAFPQHKLFEPSLSMMAVLTGVVLILSPAPATFVLAGAIVGATAFIGINYGLYLGAAMFLIAALGALKGSAPPILEAASAFFGGLALAATPLILMFALVPRFARVFFERRVTAIIQRGSSNLPLEKPWPWRPVPVSIKGLPRIGQHCVRWVFLLMPALCWTVAIAAWFLPWSVIDSLPVVVAAGFIGSFVFHHAMSRADLPHLAQSIAPLILGLFGSAANIPFAWITVFLVLALVSAYSVVQMYPLICRRRNPNAFSALEVTGNTLWFPTGFVQTFNQVRTQLSAHLQPGETVLALPTLIAWYPMLRLRSPVYDVFCVYPATKKEEERMLHSIQSCRVRFAAINNSALDGRDELRFSKTHPQVWAYLQAHFERIETPGSDSQLHILRRRSESHQRNQ